MCIPLSQRSRRSRRMIVLANLCIATGILLINVVHPSSQAMHTTIDGVGGLLLGIAIGIMLLDPLVRRICSNGKP